MPENLIGACVKKGVKDLTVVSNNAGKYGGAASSRPPHGSHVRGPRSLSRRWPRRVLTRRVLWKEVEAFAEIFVCEAAFGGVSLNGGVSSGAHVRIR